MDSIILISHVSFHLKVILDLSGKITLCFYKSKNYLKLVVLKRTRFDVLPIYQHIFHDQ